jgi:hypothetical protein
LVASWATEGRANKRNIIQHELAEMRRLAGDKGWQDEGVPQSVPAMLMEPPVVSVGLGLEACSPP